MHDLLLITPPFTQLNTPYPATAYLKGFLNTKNISSRQLDLGIEVILRVFTASGLRQVFEEARTNPAKKSENAKRMLAMQERYVAQVDSIIFFLQGKQESFARQICIPGYLPQAARFEQMQDLDWAFGDMGMQDRAKHLATLFLEDISDLIVECVDPHFGFSRYAERLAMSAHSFDQLHAELQQPLSFIDDITLDLFRSQLQNNPVKMVCLSVPFPGNLYSALRIGQCVKAEFPAVKVAMGGGFPNTELRSLSDARVFDFVDYICLDDGELPIELLVNAELNPDDEPSYKRTFMLCEGVVTYKNDSSQSDYKQRDLGVPDYDGLSIPDYVSVIEVTNPMHSLWSDGKWLKLTMAHGCYWGKCTFCDVSLDYIRLYEPVAASTLVDRMEQMMAQTGQRGFHFVDEAAPPALMRDLAIEIIRRGLSLSWWTNIRFESRFTADLCRLLRASGCIAVSGGLEVASDRLLELIDKGVTVEQVAQVTANFAEAGIMTHAYLMYGYPSQTEQETIDSLEMVRQLFESGVIRSGFWHRFALTAHSPIGLDPEAYGIIPQQKQRGFAHNDVEFEDSTGIDHGKFSFGLRKSLFNYMQGIGFDYPLQFWFEEDIPKASIAPSYIADCIAAEGESVLSKHTRIIYVGTMPQLLSRGKEKTKFIVHAEIEAVSFSIASQQANWLISTLEQLQPISATRMTLSALRASYERSFEGFDRWWSSEPIVLLREVGLLAV